MTNMTARSLTARSIRFGRRYLTLLFLVTWFLPQPASAGCDQPHGPGAAFYKFDKLILYFAVLPREGDQLKPGFPEELRTKGFIKQTEAVAHAAFADCLKTESGIDKPVIATQTPTEDFFDPRNVVLYIWLRGPFRFNNTKDGIYAILQESTYRAGLSSEDTFSILTHNQSFALFPSLNPLSPLSTQLETSLQAVLKPYAIATGHPVTQDGATVQTRTPDSFQH